MSFTSNTTGENGEILGRVSLGNVPNLPHTNDYVIAAPLDLEVDRWYHVALTFSQTARRVILYVDGQEVAAQDVADLPLSPWGTSHLLGRIDNGGQSPPGFLHGDIDETSVYNRALTPDEILAIFEAESRYE